MGLFDGLDDFFIRLRYSIHELSNCKVPVGVANWSAMGSLGMEALIFAMHFLEGSSRDL